MRRFPYTTAIVLECGLLYRYKTCTRYRSGTEPPCGAYCASCCCGAWARTPRATARGSTADGRWLALGHARAIHRTLCEHPHTATALGFHESPTKQGCVIRPRSLQTNAISKRLALLCRQYMVLEAPRQSFPGPPPVGAATNRIGNDETSRRSTCCNLVFDLQLMQEYAIFFPPLSAGSLLF